MSGLSLTNLVNTLRRQQQDDEVAWLQENLAFREELPRVGGFGAAEDLLALLVRTIQVLKQFETTVNILEMGSGLSTLVISQTLRQLGEGQLFSLEHGERFARRTQEWLTEQELNEYCEVLHAPLMPCPIEMGASQWYDLSQLPKNIQFNLLVIDGPPAWFNGKARSPAIPLLSGQIAPHAVIVVDDYHRRGEKRSVQKWLEDFPQLQLAEMKTKKGTALLQWNSPLD